MNAAAPLKGMLNMGKIDVHMGKGSQSQMLPSRHALNVLTKGDPSQRTIGNYGKLTPVGRGAPGTYDDIEAMGQAGISLKNR